MIEIVTIGPDNVHYVAEFVATLGSSRKTFTYFDSRRTDHFPNHLLTAVALRDGVPVGYGHLDREDAVTWLGVAFSENETGKGYGKMMMEFLLRKADELKIRRIQLSVKTGNDAAIALYEKFGFRRFQESGNNIFFERNL